MNRKFLPVLSCFIFVGCDGDAIEFAKQTRALLDEYQKNVNGQISRTTKYYNQDAEIARSAGARQLNDLLGVDREERSSELAADYLEGRKSVSLYRTHIRTYAQIEYDTRKGSLQSGIDTALPYVQQLAKLEADRETVEALGKALDTLQKKRSLKTEGEDLKGFVTETKRDFNLMVCADLKRKKVDLDQKVAAESGASKISDQAQSEVVAKLRTDRRCDDIEKAVHAAPKSVP